MAHIPENVTDKDIKTAINLSFSNFSYPAVVLDVGSSRLPKNDVFTMNDVKIYEIACCSISDKNINLNELEKTTFYCSIDDDTPKDISIRDIEEITNLLLSSKSIISHNASTDLKLIDLARLSLKLDDKKLKYLPYFCTMENGAYFSTSHIYYSDKKVKKYPKLQQLVEILFEERVEKGIIFDDLDQCFMCFKYLEALSEKWTLGN